MRSYPLLKIHTIADPAHVNDVMSELLVTQLTKPIISSRIKGGVRGGGAGGGGARLHFHVMYTIFYDTSNEKKKKLDSPSRFMTKCL